MSAPLESAEFKNLYVGDPRDDDGQVIDSLVQEVDAPAEPIIEAIDQEPLENPKPITRLLSGTLIVTSADFLTPTMILPPDNNRIHLLIRAYSLAATPAAKDYVQLADENGKSSAPQMSYRLRHGTSHVLDDYTGAIFVMPGPITTDNVELTWVAVTS